MSILSKKVKTMLSSIKIYRKRNEIILDDIMYPAIPNQVNLHWFSMSHGVDGIENLGDYLSVIVTEYMKTYYEIEKREISETRHLYAIGSILQIGFQKATVWGSGFVDNPVSWKKRILFRYLKKLDVRAIRGPLTRNALLELGYDCPEIYGDPAILMPMIYKPRVFEKSRKYSIVKHMHDLTECSNVINIRTRDYKSFIDELVTSERIISSSLHGIILAEAYGVPAVLYMPEGFSNSLFKYKDYYYGTKRYNFPIAKTIEEALEVEPVALPDLHDIRKNLIDAFPDDIWLDV